MSTFLSGVSPHLAVREWSAGWVECGVQQGPGEVVQGQVAMDVGVEVEGRVGWGSFAVCEELGSDSGRRSGVEPAGGQARGGSQGGRTGVLVAHVAFAGVLDLFYLRMVTRAHTRKLRNVFVAPRFRP